jgi:hypothetical protein
MSFKDVARTEGKRNIKGQNPVSFCGETEAQFA